METESKCSNLTRISQRLKNKFFSIGPAISPFSILPEETSHSKCRSFLKSPYFINKEGYTSTSFSEGNFNTGLKENMQKETTPQTMKAILMKKKLLFKKINAILEDAPDRNSLLDTLFETLDHLDIDTPSKEAHETSDTLLLETKMQAQENPESEVSMLVNITNKNEVNDTEVPNRDMKHEQAQNKTVDESPKTPGTITNTEASNRRRASRLKNSTRTETRSRRSSSRLRNTPRIAPKSKFEELLESYYEQKEHKKLSAELRSKKRKRVAGSQIHQMKERKKENCLQWTYG